MKFADLLQLLGSEPLFFTATLLAGDVDPKDLQRQLSRWTQSGRILQLRRGLYALAEPYRKIQPHPFLIANNMWRASYVSCQSALAHHGLIPEAVFAHTSVTTGRPQHLSHAFGHFLARHIKRDLFFGYTNLDLGHGQKAFVARPEKALLDLIHLEPGGDQPSYIEGLRLQNLHRLDLDLLKNMAARTKKPKLIRATTTIVKLAEQESQDYEVL